MRAKRVRVSDGAVLDADPRLIADRVSHGSFDTTMAGAFDGQHLVTAFTQSGGVVATGSTIRMARLKPDGTILDPGGALVASDPDWYLYDPVVSASPKGHVLAGYVKLNPDPGLNVERLHFRWYGLSPPTPDGGIGGTPDATSPDAAADVAPVIDAGVDALPGMETGSVPDGGASEVASIADAGAADGAASDGSPGPDGSAGVADGDGLRDGPPADGSAGPDGSAGAADAAHADAGGAPDGAAQGGNSDASGSTTDAGPASPEPGCSCRLAGRGSSPGPLALSIFFAALLARRRRR
jgi:MYXO-CTERM domain-containing protein